MAILQGIRLKHETPSLNTFSTSFFKKIEKR